MIWAACWQWSRYKYKKHILQSYANNKTAAALEFKAGDDQSYQDLLHKKVTVKGAYDFSLQLIVTNRKHRSGPGHWLLTPLKLADSEKKVIVNRGFIPFRDSEESKWRKYNTEQGEVSVVAVVKESVPHRSLVSAELSSGELKEGLRRKWLYPDIEKIAEQLPGETITSVYLHALEKQGSEPFPAPVIALRVPPSTHFGYTIEWILLAAASLVIGFLLQAFPRNKKLESEDRHIAQRTLH